MSAERTAEYSLERPHPRDDDIEKTAYDETEQEQRDDVEHTV
jgi:hypothetical protein